MPPKNKQPQSRSKRGSARAAPDSAALEELVRVIEGRVNKQGMTKSQLRSLEAKKVDEAIDKLQGRRLMLTPSQLRSAMIARQAMQQEAMANALYVNVPVPLTAEERAWQEVAPGRYIRYEQFSGDDADMEFIVALFTKELTEPYSSFTYQYFVMGWPDLCVIAYGVERPDGAAAPDASVKGEKVGAVVSRVTRKGPGMPLRGYVAMFAVIPSFRGFRLGSRLVALTVSLMRKKDCDEVYLETPTKNERALGLYLNLGFAKTKFLPRYYLDHSDAVRLKLWLKDAVPDADHESARNGGEEVNDGAQGSKDGDASAVAATVTA